MASKSWTVIWHAAKKPFCASPIATMQKISLFPKNNWDWPFVPEKEAEEDVPKRYSEVQNILDKSDDRNTCRKLADFLSTGCPAHG